MVETTIIVGRILVFVSIVSYLVFAYLEQRQVRDEREQLIHLKSLELVNKATTTALAFFVVISALWPEMPAIIPIIALVVTTMYFEIGGKIYFRRHY